MFCNQLKFLLQSQKLPSVGSQGTYFPRYENNDYWDMQIEDWVRVHRRRELPKARASRNLRTKVLGSGKFGGSQPEVFLTSVKSKIYTDPRVLRSICSSQYIVLLMAFIFIAALKCHLQARTIFLNIVCACVFLLVSLLFWMRLLKFVILQHLLVSILKQSAFT